MRSFTKNLNLSNSLDKREYEIVSHLIKHPYQEKCKNIVTILDLTPEAIVMEKLDTNKKPDDRFQSDMDAAVEYLNSIGIVYIDWKHDNIGFSHIDNCWKLFDFNVSGLVDLAKPLQWIVEPDPMCWMYTQIEKHIETNNIQLHSYIEYDTIARRLYLKS